MGRYFRALWYFVTGRFTAAAEALQGNKYVMSATYDKAIEKSEERYHTVRDALAKMVGIEEEKLVKVKSLTARYEQLEKVKKGALAKGKDVSNRLKAEGVPAEEIQRNSEFLKHMSVYQDAATSAKEKEAEIEELEADIALQRQQIDTYKNELRSMQKKAEELQQEKNSALADMAIAQEMQSVNDILSGVAEDTIDKDLEAARNKRKEAKAKAKISAEIAGTDAKAAEEEYANYASSNDASNEFASLIGLTDDPTSGDLDPAKLPE